MLQKSQEIQKRKNVNFHPQIQALQAALGTESRVCYLDDTTDKQPQWALTYCHISQSTANQNERVFIVCWDLNL
jgi:hypothetical protein